MSKHTPGPWSHTLGDGLYIVLATKELVAKAVGQNQETDEANARLIAAAPEMLETLRAIAKYCCCDEYSKSELISVIRNGERLASEAIAKAEGTTSKPYCLLCEKDCEDENHRSEAV